uniref:(northern house mosquito) hypothetical protein n=1 Tax=Culex pipiens TaxID=7175 RepID=A0A8D8BRM9_CULPI
MAAEVGSWVHLGKRVDLLVKFCELYEIFSETQLMMIFHSKHIFLAWLHKMVQSKHSNKRLEHDRSLLQRSILRKNRLQSTGGDHRFQSKESYQHASSVGGHPKLVPSVDHQSVRVYGHQQKEHNLHVHKDQEHPNEGRHPLGHTHDEQHSQHDVGHARRNQQVGGYSRTRREGHIHDDLQNECDVRDGRQVAEQLVDLVG